jgi:carboxyl-terminal processing protease
MRTKTFTFLLLLNCPFGFAQTDFTKANKSSTEVADSINVFYKALFKSLKVGYLHRRSVDWKSVEDETYTNLQSYNTFNTSLKEITHLFDKIEATHCMVYRGNDKYTVTRKVISKDHYSTQWKSKYDSKPQFELKVIDGKYGYILMPGMVFSDNSAKHMSQIAQPMYDEILKVKTANNIKGWIIDLRFNTGGNSAPMLLALYDFLGNTDIWAELDEKKKLVRKFKLSGGSYIQKSQTIAAIEPNGKLLDKEKVALITGIFTGSSGEVTALAFKGRQNTIFIGENTAGYTTGNVTWPLPFDTFIALTTGYDSDRNGNYYPHISPDVVVSKQDNFQDLMSDGNVQEAIKFINAM